VHVGAATGKRAYAYAAGGHLAANAKCTVQVSNTAARHMPCASQSGSSSGSIAPHPVAPISSRFLGEIYSRNSASSMRCHFPVATHPPTHWQIIVSKPSASIRILDLA
jgi:hypothetical protein